MDARTDARTLGDVLADRRRRRLVGRGPELRLFEEALAGPGGRVLLVHGPGGIGKTSLLARYAELATELPETDVRHIDGRSVPPSSDAIAALLRLDERDGSRRLVVLVDGYERLAQLDPWVRTTLLPSLPADTVAVLAGRTRPDPTWTADPAWQHLVARVPLRNLDPAACREHLVAAGVAEEAHRPIIRLTHGHPLGLALITALATEEPAGAGLSADLLPPDLVTALLRRFLGSVPTPKQRRALAVCALARATDEPLLRAALDAPDAGELFDWLRSQSFVDSGPHGLVPHDLARDVLDAELRWRDRTAYDDLFRRVGHHLIGRLARSDGVDRIELLFDVKFLHRYQPVSGVWADWSSFGRYRPEPARLSDHRDIVTLVRRWEGDRSAAIAEHWLARQPEGFVVVRDGDGALRGVLALVDLTAASPADLAADPVAAAAGEHATSGVAPRAGERVTMTRFMVDRERHQRPSPTVNLGPVLSIDHFLRAPGLCLHLIAVTEPERWEEYFTFYEIPRVPGTDIPVDDLRYGLFGRDFRHLPVGPWLSLMLERDLTGERAVPPVDDAAVMVLSEPDFAAAARDALGRLHRPDLLEKNPLVRSSLVRARSAGRTAPQTLQELLREAVDGLRDDPRDEKLVRVLDRTFLRPAGSQEKAAQVLDLPLSTYKRHLRAAVDRVVTSLWRLELAGYPDPAGPGPGRERSGD